MTDENHTIRLYVIGSQTFGQAVKDSVAMTAVGLATVLSAEIGQIVFSLALATLGTSQASRRLLYGSMALATLVSLTGNIQVSLLDHTDSPFAWLEAVTPPLLVLSTAYVLKEQILSAIETRHANEVSYQAALAEWQVATSHPEAHPQWSQFYANALKDGLRKANNRHKETITQMTQNDWRMAVTREMEAELWYAAPTPHERVHVVPSANGNTLTPSNNGNGTFPKVTAGIG